MAIGFKVKGYNCLVDDQDADLATWKWYPLVQENKHGVYLQKSDMATGRSTTIRLHRIIMERVLNRKLEKGEKVDHEDRNGLNNQRYNLRLANNSQNIANAKTRIDSKLGVKGVRKSGNRFEARITYNGTQEYLGMFRTPEDAHAAYCKAAVEHFGEFARFE